MTLKNYNSIKINIRGDNEHGNILISYKLNIIYGITQ